ERAGELQKPVVVGGGLLGEGGSPGSFSSGSVPNEGALSGDNLPWKVGVGGRVEPNLDWEGPNGERNIVPPYYAPQSGADFFKYTKGALLDLSSDLTAAGVANRDSFAGNAAMWAGAIAGGVTDVLYPGSDAQAAAIWATGPIVSKGVGLLTDAAVSKFPVLGM